MLSEMVNTLFCSNLCRSKLAHIRAHNFNLINEYNSAMTKCISLRESNKLLTQMVEEQKDISQLHKDLNQEQSELELPTDKYQQNELNIKKFDTYSDTVRNLCDVQLAYKENKGKGLGYKQVPLPYNHNYSRMPTTEQDLKNEKNMMYGKPSDNVSWEPYKPKHARPTDFRKPMDFFKTMDSTQNVSNESIDELESEVELVKMSMGGGSGKIVKS
ncbi:hypothetical protein Hanom_Chr03g00202811 [Helianthus anomalus]